MSEISLMSVYERVAKLEREVRELKIIQANMAGKPYDTDDEYEEPGPCTCGHGDVE